MRKTIIALFALAAVGLVQPTVASARGGGGHGGGFGSFLARCGMLTDVAPSAKERAERAGRGL